MKKLLLIAALIAALFLPSVALAQTVPFIPELQGNSAGSKATTPEQKEANRKAAEAYKAKKLAEREALAIAVEGQAIRVWHRGKDLKASKSNHPTHKAKPEVQPIQGKLIKIYPDAVILEMKDSTTLEVPRKEFQKADRELIAKIAEKNTK